MGAVAAGAVVVELVGSLGNPKKLVVEFVFPDPELYLAMLSPPSDKAGAVAAVAVVVELVAGLGNPKILVEEFVVFPEPESELATLFPPSEKMGAVAAGAVVVELVAGLGNPKKLVVEVGFPDPESELAMAFPPSEKAGAVAAGAVVGLGNPKILVVEFAGFPDPELKLAMDGRLNMQLRSRVRPLLKKKQRNIFPMTLYTTKKTNNPQAQSSKLLENPAPILPPQILLDCSSILSS